jgi:predicted amidophosphoribosyltransferase
MQNFMNPETHELYYEPIKLGLFSVIKRYRAFVRCRIYGFCPACNSDAPKLYDCKVCKYDTTSPFNRTKRKQYWNDWKYYDFINAFYTLLVVFKKYGI